MRHASAIWSPLCSLLLCYLFIDYWISRALVLMRGHRHCSAYAHCWNTGIRDPVFCCGISTQISLGATNRVESWLTVPEYPIDRSAASPSFSVISTSYNWWWFLKEIQSNEFLGVVYRRGSKQWVSPRQRMSFLWIESFFYLNFISQTKHFISYNTVFLLLVMLLHLCTKLHTWLLVRAFHVAKVSYLPQISWCANS